MSPITRRLLFALVAFVGLPAIQASAQGLSRERIEELARETMRTMVRKGITIKDSNLYIRDEFQIIDMMIFNSTEYTASDIIVECDLVDSAGDRVTLRRVVPGPLPAGFGLRFPINFGLAYPQDYRWTSCRVLDARI